MAISTDVARFTPNAATIDSVASSLPRKLAAETLATAPLMVNDSAFEVPYTDRSNEVMALAALSTS